MCRFNTKKFNTHKGFDIVKIKGVTIFLLILPWLISACGKQSQTPIVGDVWARPGNAGDNSAIYFTITNPGAEDDLLIAASSQVATTTELHMSMMDSSGTMKMEHQASVPIPSKSEVQFEPGGLHVMLVGLIQDLKEGDQFPLSLNFQESGEIEVDVTVKNP
jgi:copper(I)-binding protein